VLRKVHGEIPILIMEGDIVDISAYNEADTHNRIDAFIEVLEETRRSGNVHAGRAAWFPVSPHPFQD
jgi:hypothetical protein